ncbi:hypothetical protein CHS0354_043063 [Potamilus streckersoni]|uniref:Uncharacterized protein n=1 Tax=Potamilus streckersoni TaxID=2493646 RepID=A0AAE0SD03_9BIVA|nr:hypothetical protein CHS0354_043063 [Potamilus streckersoni]
MSRACLPSSRHHYKLPHCRHHSSMTEQLKIQKTHTHNFYLWHASLCEAKVFVLLFWDLGTQSSIRCGKDILSSCGFRHKTTGFSTEPVKPHVHFHFTKQTCYYRYSCRNVHLYSENCLERQPIHLTKIVFQDVWSDS